MISLETLLKQLSRTATTPEQKGLMLEMADRARVLENRLSLMRGTGMQVAELVDRCRLYGPADALRERARLLRALAQVDSMGTTPFDDVRAFSEKFGFQPPELPRRRDDHTRYLRIRLIKEEAHELEMALLEHDLGAIAQESIDLLYVTYGALVDFGIRPEPIWEAVHRANMEKIPNPDGGKVLKPEGWTKPNCAKLVEEQS